MPKTDSNNGLAAYADGSVDEGYAMGPASAAACSGASAVDDHTAPGGAFESIAEEASSDQTADGTEEAAQQQRVDDSIKDIIEVATKAFVDEWADQEYDSDNNSDHSGRDRLFSEETFAVAESDHKDIDGWAGDTNGEEGSVVSGGCECRSAGFADEDVVDEYTEKSKDA
ncbi:unnamed protein product [Symbiodinium microadriaticum]|nr:unnamed protein product [Symbiodinium microadriaticum]